MSDYIPVEERMEKLEKAVIQLQEVIMRMQQAEMYRRNIALDHFNRGEPYPF